KPRTNHSLDLKNSGKGNDLVASLIASNTHFWALLRTDRVSVHPVAISVISRVKQNSPLELPPSWPTRSISIKPGRSIVPVGPGPHRNRVLQQGARLGM